MSDSLNIQTTLRAANIARQAEWDPSDKITLTYRLNELAGETGEACNVGKKIERERLGIRGSRDTVEHLAEELADVVICADLVAMAEGIDLDAAVVAKFNATSEEVGLKTRLAAPAHEGAAALDEAIARVSAWANYPHTTAEQIAVKSPVSTFTAGDLRVILAELATRAAASPLEWKRTPSNHLFGRTIRPEDVDHLEAGSLLRLYSSNPWFDDSGDMPKVGQIVRFTGNVERERFPAVAPHLEVAALDGRVYPGGGWQCHLFQFASPPDTAHALEGGAV